MVFSTRKSYVEAEKYRDKFDQLALLSEQSLPYEIQDYVDITKAVINSIGSCVSRLEKTTKNIDKHLPFIEAGKMPEYNQALEAIKKYQEAVQTKINPPIESEKQHE